MLPDDQRTPSWFASATCRGLPVRMFYPERGEKSLTLLCRQCPVQKDCLQYALDTRQIWGIWGGTSERWRRRFRRVRRSPEATKAMLAEIGLG